MGRAGRLPRALCFLFQKDSPNHGGVFRGLNVAHEHFMDGSLSLLRPHCYESLP